MKIGIIVQARMTFTRLTGKILMDLIYNKSMLELQIERLKKVKLSDTIIIATTTNKEDDPVIELCKNLDINYFRGSEPDVLSRYYHAATLYSLDGIVRITGDCPLIDPAVVDLIIQTFKEGQYDYVSNIIERTYPRGLDTEIFKYSILKNIYENIEDESYREHVTLYIVKHYQQYNCLNIKNNNDYSSYRLTVDTIEDYRLIKLMYNSLYLRNPNFLLEDCIDILKANPDWIKINQHIEQKIV